MGTRDAVDKRKAATWFMALDLRRVRAERAAWFYSISQTDGDPVSLAWTARNFDISVSMLRRYIKKRKDGTVVWNP